MTYLSHEPSMGNPSLAELLETKATLILDVLSQALMLREKYALLFQDTPEGVYFRNTSYPILKKGCNYYTQSSYESGEPIHDLTNVREAVLDTSGKTILNAFVMKRQKLYLTNEPIIPIQALRLMRYEINRYISDVTVPNRIAVDNELETILTEEGIRLYEDGYLDQITSLCYNTIDEFVQADRWHIYFVELNGVDVIIKKTSDYRVYIYHKLIESGTITDHVFPKHFGSDGADDS